MALIGGSENFESHNLRHFLTIEDDDRRANFNQSTASNGVGRRHSLTLNAILSEKRASTSRHTGEPPLQQPIQSNRTLLDIIREDQTSVLGVGDRRDGRRSWRQLREKIRIRTGAGGSAWSSTVRIPASDLPINDNNYNNRTMMMMMTRRHSTRFDPIHDPAESSQPDPGPTHNRSSSARRQLTSEDNRRPHDHAEVEMEEDDGTAEHPVRMSLMALLAENDRQMGVEGSAFVMDEEEDVAEEEEESAAVAISGYSCCVCMVRHKGAAFIPCGHTFCRLCSRELWVQRGNCPLCNHYILEVLDIF